MSPLHIILMEIFFLEKSLATNDYFIRYNPFKLDTNFNCSSSVYRYHYIQSSRGGLKVRSDVCCRWKNFTSALKDYNRMKKAIDGIPICYSMAQSPCGVDKVPCARSKTGSSLCTSSSDPFKYKCSATSGQWNYSIDLDTISPFGYTYSQFKCRISDKQFGWSRQDGTAVCCSQNDATEVHLIKKYCCGLSGVLCQVYSINGTTCCPGFECKSVTRNRKKDIKKCIKNPKEPVNV